MKHRRITVGVCAAALAAVLVYTAVAAQETGNADPKLQTEDEASDGTDGGQDAQIQTPCLEAGIQFFFERESSPEDSAEQIALTGTDVTGNTEGAEPPEGTEGLEGTEPPEETEGSEENEYADLAIANVRHYVNVRNAPGTDGAIVGRIYNGAVAQVLCSAGENQDWFQIVSGNVEGYIKAEYFLYGDEAAAVIDDYVSRYAVVEATRLNVRKEPDLEARRIGYIDRGEKVRILEDMGEWLKVQYTDDSSGYVASEYVSVSEEFAYAKTMEEVEQELAAQRALKERQETSETTAQEDTDISVAPPNTTYATNDELRQQIVDYAMQFLGNKYRHGGQSLTTGTDCSGFTSLIYKDFGYSISRTPSGQLSSAGRSIDYSEAKPGDIICYGSQKCTHVALYIGDGQIIHAANSRKGVIISQADYDHILGVKNVID